MELAEDRALFTGNDSIPALLDAVYFIKGIPRKTEGKTLIFIGEYRNFPKLPHRSQTLRKNLQCGTGRNDCREKVYPDQYPLVSGRAGGRVRAPVWGEWNTRVKQQVADPYSHFVAAPLAGEPSIVMKREC